MHAVTSNDAAGDENRMLVFHSAMLAINLIPTKLVGIKFFSLENTNNVLSLIAYL